MSTRSHRLFIPNPRRSLALLLVLLSLLAVPMALSTKKALADAGGFPTPTVTATRIPTNTPTPTFIPAPTATPFTPVAPLPTATATIALPTDAPPLVVVTQEPPGRGGLGLICWPFLLLFILAVIIASIVLFGRRTQQTA